MSYTIRVPAADLRRAWEMVAGAASRDPSRPYLGAVRLSLSLAEDYPTLRLVATDGHELRWADVVSADRRADARPAELPPPLAVPADALDEEGPRGRHAPVELTWPTNSGPARIAGADVMPVQGFPDAGMVDRLIPTNAPAAPLVVPAPEWIAGLRAAAAVAPGEHHATTIRIRAGATAAFLRTADQRSRLAAVVRVPLDRPAPADVAVRVDARRLARLSHAVAGSARYLWIAVGPPRRPLTVLPARSPSAPHLTLGAVVIPIVS
jgi:hypothetical protein